MEQDKYNTIRLEIVLPNGELALTPIYVRPAANGVDWSLQAIQVEAKEWLANKTGGSLTDDQIGTIILNGSLLVGYRVSQEDAAKQIACTPDTIHECYRDVRFDDPSS